MMSNTNPTVEELASIDEQARMLAESSIVPRDYAGKPANIRAAALMGRTYGWDATTSMRNLCIINGVATIKPEAMLALIRAAGHSVAFKDTTEGVWVRGVRCDNGDTTTTAFTLDDARHAGLLHGGAWQTYPLDMCRWRAVSRLARSLFADVVAGAGYVPEEIQSAAAANTTESVGDAGEPGEPGDRDWVGEAHQSHDIAVLRALYVTAQQAGAGESVLRAIHDHARDVIDTATPTPEAPVAAA